MTLFPTFPVRSSPVPRAPTRAGGWSSGPSSSPGTGLVRLTTTAVLALAALVPAAEALSAQTAVDDWLVAGPVPAARPALAEDADSALFRSATLSFGPRWPEAGGSVAWLGEEGLQWRPRAAAEDGTLRLPTSGAAAGESDMGARAAYAVSYLKADRWQEVRLEIESTGGLVRATLNGEHVTDGGQVELGRGKHRLAVRTVRPTGAEEEWSVAVKAEPLTDGATVAATTDPRRTPSWMDLRDRLDFREVAVSPDGGRVAVVTRGVDRENDEWVDRLQVRSLEDGAVTAEVPAAAGISGPAWSPDADRLAFTAPTDREGAEGRDLWVWRPGAGGARRVLRAERGLSNLMWGADGRWIYFTADVERSDDPDPDDIYTRLTEVWERWPYWPHKTRLYAMELGEGTRHELAGDPEYSVSGPAISPDGTRIVFTRNVRRNERPYVTAEVRVLDLESREARTLLELGEESFGGPSGYAWSPDGRAIAFCAPLPEALEGESPEASVFETELFATSVENPRLRWLSEGFEPAVGGGLGCSRLQWSAEDGRVYVGVEDGARNVPARTAAPVESDAPAGTLERMDSPGHHMGTHDFGAGRLVATFESPVSPPALYRMDLGSGASRQLAAPGLEAGGQLRMPGWEEWEFESADGFPIEAWYWTPPDFDPGREYPVIVHYYGGTLAQKERFDEQLVWYASKGYVVFMLNPAGAPGYGHEFSAQHIGDWGYPAGTDVIEGVTRFAEAHDFVDRERIGNFGGSYGGFLTMHLLARTEGLFAAAAERAGISNITEYWGAGWWGYSYTDGTCPGCYPWNRPDVFVDRSPVFHAEEITEPLLVLHGTADHNVPLNESDQIFTALRALDREVEYVRFRGESHGIGSTPGVRRAFESMMLEWYDLHLRDRPAAWNARWEEEKEE